MAFSKRERREKKPANGMWLGRFLGGVVRFFVRVTFGVAVVTVLSAGLLYLRLSQGPIHLSFVAKLTAQMLNNDTDQFEIELEDMVLTIGEAGGPAGVQFVNIRVTSANGESLFAVPRLSAKFDVPDLLGGHLRPTQIVLIGPEARMLRTREGKFRFGLGAQSLAGDVPGDTTGDITGNALVGETPQLEAITSIIDGFVGDSDPLPELAGLTEIVIADADLTYENAAIGRRWHTQRSDLRIYRTEEGLLARLSVGLADGAETGAGVVVIAERQRGSGGATRLDVRFDGLRPEHLAEQLDQMQWLRLFDAPLDGNLGATVYKDGRIEGLAGRISAGAGRILALQEQGQPFDSVDLAFAYEAGLERMRVSEMTLISRALDARLSGFVDLGRAASGEVTGLLGQFEVVGMRASVPDIFADPLHFDGGQIVAKLDFEPMRIEVADARLHSGDLVFGVNGQAWAADDGWHTDLRAGGRNLSVEQLIQHWPLVAAKNARKWVDKNIHSGGIDEFVAQMRFGDGEPQVNLDFVFSELVSNYLHEMTPIRDARGRGSLNLNEFRLSMESGVVVPVEGAPVRLDGSVVRMLDLQGRPSPAEITIRATGATSSILTLINEPPLELIGKLGLDRTAKEFCVGAAELTTTALLVGFARTIQVVLDDGQVIDTIIHGVAQPLQNLGPHLAAVGMLVVQSLCNLFIPSGSGQAYVTMPIMAPLADLVEVKRQVAVLAYQFGDGFTNILVPTNAVLVGILAMARIPFQRWLRFVLPFMLKIWIAASVALVIAVWVGYA